MKAMAALGVSKVGELQKFIYVEDLLENGLKKVQACKLLDTVGGVKYRPMSPEPAASSNASVREEKASGSQGTQAGPQRDQGAGNGPQRDQGAENGSTTTQGAGNGSTRAQGAGSGGTRTIADVRITDDPGGQDMPRGTYRDILLQGRCRGVWSLAQRAPLCVQTLQLVGIGMPPVEPPTKKKRPWSNPLRRGRPLLNRKQIQHIQKVGRASSNRRKNSREREPQKAPKPLPQKRPGRLNFRFSTAWADAKDDGEELCLVSYAESSGESSDAYTRMMVESLVKERDQTKPVTRGNGSRPGSQSSNGGRQKSKALGEQRDEASRGETRQDFSALSVSASSSQKVAVTTGTVDGPGDGDSLVVGSVENVLPGQGAAGQENSSEGSGVRPGQDDAGQEAVPEGAGQVISGETEQQTGGNGNNGFPADGKKLRCDVVVGREEILQLSQGVLQRIYQKVSECEEQYPKRDFPRGQNKMARNLVISASSDGSGVGEMGIMMEESSTPAAVLNPQEQLMQYDPRCDPRVLVRSRTTEWVKFRGPAERSFWGAVAAQARKICVEMEEVDQLNMQLQTGRYMFERKEEGHYSSLHTPYHANPCFQPVGNGPLSIMGVLLSPRLQEKFTNSDTFGSALEGIGYEWNKTPEMRVHVQLMDRVANLVYPFTVLMGQAPVAYTSFLWQHGRERLMEFFRASTCADELEALWRQKEDDEEEVDPSGLVLEFSGQEESVLEQGNGEVPSSSEGGKNVVGDGEAAGKAPEISPEDETADGVVRKATTRFFLQRIYEDVFEKWFTEPSLQDRRIGRMFDSTKGYPGEGPLKDGLDLSSKGMPWIPVDHLDEVVAKKLNPSVNSGEEEGCVQESGIQPEPTHVEDAPAEKILRALWWKEYRAGYERLRRSNGIGSKPGTVKVPIRAVRRPGSEKLFLKKPLIRGSAQHGSGADRKKTIKVVEPRPGFPAVSDKPRTTSAQGEQSSSQDLGNVQVEKSRPMDRYEAERQVKRQRGFCYWFSRGKNSCKFGRGRCGASILLVQVFRGWEAVSCWG